METVTVTATGLTADDVKALRQADTIGFSFGRTNGSVISATKRIKNPGPFGDDSKRWDVSVGTAFNGKHENGDRADVANAVCHECIVSAAYDECWQTVASFLKTGDELRLNWYADAMLTGYLDGATVPMTNEHGRGETLHADALYLCVTRGGKQFRFLIDVSICPSNTARMIRRA